MTTPTIDHRELTTRVRALGGADAHRLARRLDGTRKIADEAKRAGTLERIAADVEKAEQRLERRRASVPAVSYPEQLPISERVDDIKAALESHQVVVVAGETGSGKTTQLPKIALELGRGVLGTIGHTQPRRIAARTVSERVAEELGTQDSDVVGYQVRFTSHASEDTLVKLMTDGILLAEIQQDRLLRRYDTLIIDEAHERSLNIDFLLGYLAQLLPRRPDLKVIITSATIDPERFSKHFGDAPIIEVSGRTFPVEVRYRPLVDPDDAGGASGATGNGSAAEERDQLDGIVDAVEELRREGPGGDVLVFLAGEREIRDTADALNALPDRPTDPLDVLPLYARLSAAEQHRVFEPGRSNHRRIVLATNVAETSLTVPGIRYVIDPGLARISRYSQRTKVQRLPIEKISQASATQRAGRCGRVADGICVRLYSEDDFDARQEFTDPEIQRTNLASVILQMAGAKLGPIEEFPFVDPPETRAIRDGVRLLTELGAVVDGDATRLTDIGRNLARLPVDPRIARMILAADQLGCLHEVTVIAAGLSAQDPRERPTEKIAEADAAHARFTDARSDFLSWLHLWEHVRTSRRELSGNRFRKQCAAEYLNFLRIREWQDLAAQLRQLGDELGLTRNEPGQEITKDLADRVHQALLTGLLSQLGLAHEPPKPKQGQPKPKRKPITEYEGSRGARFAVWPGSTLAKRPPTFVMAAELVETSRLWARTVAGIDPAWAEQAAGDLVTRTYSEPRWSKRRGSAVATERVTLFGVPLAMDRSVDFGRIDPELSRELFLRHALVEGDWNGRHAFVRRNAAELERVAEMERRARRELLVDEDTIFRFYDERVPASVVSARHFDRWWQKASRRDPHLLDLDPRALLAHEAPDAEAYPDEWRAGGLTLPLSYAFEPGAEHDGVTVTVPLAVLGQVRAEDLAWQVPGLREEMLTSLVRSLPKPLRRSLVPAPDTARALLARLAADRRPADGEPLLGAVSDAVKRLSGVDVPVDAWNVAGLPSHLRLTFQVIDDDGSAVADGTDLNALRRTYAQETKAAVAKVADGLERRGLTSFAEVGELPRTREQERSGGTVTAHLALVDEGTRTDPAGSVGVGVFDSALEARDAMRAGTRRLLLRAVSSPAKALVRSLDNRAVLRLRGSMAESGYRDVADLADDCVVAAIDGLVSARGGPAWNPPAFETLRADVTARLAGGAAEVLTRAEAVLAEANTVRLALDELAARPGSGMLDAALDDVRAQLSALVGGRFASRHGVTRLPDVVRWLRAAAKRLEKLPTAPRRDAELTDEVHAVAADYRARREKAEQEPRTFDRDAWDAVAAMIQELRVSRFAQEVGTAGSISPQRIAKALGALTRP
ncbi:ATP-dependent RNA helicase HrpA [Actinomycetospora endophytica]|uniref:ATP-dependent RNA helicase HrpA n=1 Tax=Actinomycetospora endophytica TaxID=2291215 RepID=A0ABS8P3F4_9PSEU|nr:ATP-dependent RNA helicase HrpA [Actinomycetospora endophytica]MCD2192782.1 ATP-dependent RNA helicase HrpA [Actinomycetospora endophytica]